MKKKFTVPNQPVRKLCEEKGLSGKHREISLHGAEVCLWEGEPREGHLPQTQKGDQSQVGGVRAKPQPEGRRSWLGVRCPHCHPALAAQHEILPTSDRTVMAWVTPAPGRHTEGFCFSYGQLSCGHTLQPQLCHKLHRGSLNREVEREVPFVNPIPSTHPRNTEIYCSRNKCEQKHTYFRLFPLLARGSRSQH